MAVQHQYDYFGSKPCNVHLPLSTFRLAVSGPSVWDLESKTDTLRNNDTKLRGTANEYLEFGPGDCSGVVAALNMLAAIRRLHVLI